MAPRVVLGVLVLAGSVMGCGKSGDPDRGAGAPEDAGLAEDLEPQAPPTDPRDGELTRLLDADGAIDCDQYRALAASPTATLWHYKLGPTSAAFHPGGATVSTHLPPGRADGRYCYGNCAAEAVDWAGYAGQVLFLPEAGAAGMDRTRLSWSKHDGHGGAEFGHLYLLAPLNAPRAEDSDSWFTAAPDPSFAQAGWEAALTEGVPLAIGRGRVTWSNNALVAYRSGLVGAVGSGNSGDTFPVLQLPAGRIPTALALTPNNELAVVTLWDPEACAGELAVLALNDRGQPWLFPGPGFFEGIKLLGTIELEGLRAPTAVAVTVNLSRWDWPSDVDLADATVRQQWLDGVEGRRLADAGYAVVASRDESAVAFVDLGPTLRWIRGMYLGSDSDFAQTEAEGPADDAWPHTFAAAPSAAPAVVASFAVEQPTLVVAGYDVGDRAYLSAEFGARAFVTTLDGALVSFDTTALMAPTGGAPERLGDTPLCNNPTDVAVGRGGGARDLMLFTCRGDRSLSFVSPTGEVLDTLLDDRLSDPVTAILTDTRGASVVSVGDLGQARVLSYLNGPIDAWGEAIFGDLTDGARFELTGALEVGGGVVALSAAQVP